MRFSASLVEAERAQEVDGRDLGDVGQHDDPRDGDPPAAQPADPRPQRLGAPRERGPAVRHDRVELAVRDGGQQHRDERDEEHGRRLLPDGQHHVAERGGQRVRRGRRREADDGVAPEAEAAGAQPFRRRRGLVGHGTAHRTSRLASSRCPRNRTVLPGARTSENNLQARSRGAGRDSGCSRASATRARLAGVRLRLALARCSCPCLPTSPCPLRRAVRPRPRCAPSSVPAPRAGRRCRGSSVAVRPRTMPMNSSVKSS